MTGREYMGAGGGSNERPPRACTQRGPTHAGPRGCVSIGGPGQGRVAHRCRWSGTQSAQTVFAPTEPFTRQPFGWLFTSTGAFSLRPAAVPPPPVALRPAGQLTVAAWLPFAVAVATVTAATPLGPCGPASPFGPCAPLSPFGPCGPASPLAPGAPVSPFGPCAPSGPPRPRSPC